MSPVLEGLPTSMLGAISRMKLLSSSMWRALTLGELFCREAGVKTGDAVNDDGVDSVVGKAGGNEIEGGEAVGDPTPRSMSEVRGDLERPLRGRGGAYTHCRSVVVQLTQAGLPSSH
ncbi:hypothetical protein OPT61_g6729 [Boeremia exigua]|uniref:Uncharacterized protein n=1 Tax=Boeremia exigua TaxID=749465 RepID=A0ACC2I5Y9_9PLEO|nr:hypothetical protein OPT61_g6729 [Boeremia exigua]